MHVAWFRLKFSDVNRIMGFSISAVLLTFAKLHFSMIFLISGLDTLDSTR